jgi:molecular chaperone GrpE
MTAHNNKDNDLDFKANDRIAKERGPLLKPATDSLIDTLQTEQTTKVDLTDVLIEANSNIVEPSKVLEEDVKNDPIIGDDSNTLSKLKEMEDKLIRVTADAVNASKQAELDLANAKKNAKKGVVKDILPFLTALTLSLAFVPENPEAKKFVESLKSSANKLATDLGGHGIELIIPKIGDEFDPSIMQALNQPSQEDPKVTNIASVGCKIDGQLISPASVLI